MGQLQARLGDTSPEDAALLALGLLDTMTRHLERPDAAVGMFDSINGWGWLSTLHLREEMFGKAAAWGLEDAALKSAAKARQVNRHKA